MKKSTYTQLLIVPVVLTTVVIAVLTYINLEAWQRHRAVAIQKITREFLEQNKHKIHRNVMEFVRELEYIRQNHKEHLDGDLRQKVALLLHTLDIGNKLYCTDENTTLPPSKLIELFPERDTDHDNITFFVIDKSTEKILSGDLPESVSPTSLIGKLGDKGDAFLDIRENGERLYFTAFKPFDWIVGAAVSMKDTEKILQKQITDKYNTLEKTHENYLFVEQLHDINGGKDYATVIITPNDYEPAGTNISDDVQDSEGKYFRKEYLKALRENGEGYVEYTYRKVHQSEEIKKLTYFYLYKPWNWVIGTGVYFDELDTILKSRELIIQKEMSRRITNTIILAIGFILLSSLISILFARKVTRVIGSYIDQLNREKNNFETLFENSPDGIILAADNIRFFACNKAIPAMFGYHTKEEFLSSRNVLDISPRYQEDGTLSEELIATYGRQCMEEGSVTFMWRLVKKNGDPFDAEITLTRITFDNNNIIHGAVRDVSEKKRLLAETLQKDALLIQQSKMAAMGEMIGHIAHQWRQPLNALGLTLQKIRMYHEEGILTTAELDKSINKSKMLIDKMSATIDDFRNFFKLDKKKERFNILVAINNTLALLEASFKYHNITVTVKTPEEHVMFEGLRNELEQVILNLLNNAKDALIENNIPNPTITIEIKEDSEQIRIEVRDNGGGIEPTILSRVFEPYFTTKDQGKGTGIGLYMSKVIIEKNMNSTIKVVNTGEGACFCITLAKEQV